MGRAHAGYDVYLGTGDDAAIAFESTIIHEDMRARVVKVRSKDDKGRWGAVYTLTDTSRLQRNGTAVRWTGTSPDGEQVTLTGISNRGGCIPCGRR